MPELFNWQAKIEELGQQLRDVDLAVLALARQAQLADVTYWHVIMALVAGEILLIFGVTFLCLLRLSRWLFPRQPRSDGPEGHTGDSAGPGSTRDGPCPPAEEPGSRSPRARGGADGRAATGSGAREQRRGESRATPARQG
jgi:hypothetical protein